MNYVNDLIGIPKFENEIPAIFFSTFMAQRFKSRLIFQRGRCNINGF